jgi:hypothetical protein
MDAAEGLTRTALQKGAFIIREESPRRFIDHLDSDIPVNNENRCGQGIKEGPEHVVGPGCLGSHHFLACITCCRKDTQFVFSKLIAE